MKNPFSPGIASVFGSILEAQLRKAPEMARRLLGNREVATVKHSGVTTVDGPGPADVTIEIELQGTLAFNADGIPTLRDVDANWTAVPGVQPRPVPTNR